jgi:hypothetical protein
MVLLNLILAVVFGFIALYVLRSVAKTWDDGIRVLIAVLIGVVVFFADLAQYIVTNH